MGVYSCSNIWGTHCSSNSCLYNMRTHNYPLLAYDASVVMVLNLFLNLLQICILQVPRRQPRPSDSVMGRRVAVQCDVFTMVLHESNPGFPLILPRYLMAIIFTAFDLAAYNNSSMFYSLANVWEVWENKINAPPTGILLHFFYSLGVSHIFMSSCSWPQTACSMHGVLMWCNQSLGVALSAEDE